MSKTLQKGNEIPTIDVNLVTISPEGSDKELALDTASKIAVEVQTETTDAVKLVIKGKLRAQKKATTAVTGNKITLTDNVFIPELAKILQGGTIKYNTKYSITGSEKEVGNYVFGIADGKYVNFNLAEALTSGDTLTFDLFTGKLVKNNSQSIPCTIGAKNDEALPLEASSQETQEIIGYNPPIQGSDDIGETFTLNAYSAQYDTAGTLVKYEKISYPNCTGEPVALSSEDGAFRAPEYTIDSAPKEGQAPYSITYVQDLPNIE